MRTDTLTATPSNTGDVYALAGLIADLGDCRFSRSLFRMASDWAKPEHMTAFVCEEDIAPSMVFAENAGPTKIAADVGDRYCQDYWQYDLADPRRHEAGRSGSWFVQTSAAEIRNREYRQHCYTAVQLDDRISLFDRRDDRTIRINLYRTKGNGFTEDDICRICDRAPLVLALVRKHAEQCSGSRQNSHAYYLTRLSSVAPALTRREADVCAAIIRGVTSEGIALELGVGLNTVLTYKKRAYARLNISSQNQLMRLVLA